jgi:thiamine-phosphate pyrophosphorylase
MTATKQRIQGLYGITPQWSDIDRIDQAVREAASGGMRIVQFRHKTADATWRASAASKLRRTCSELGVMLIINDDWSLAQAVGADGVHLGRDDPEPRVARQALGSSVIIGASCYGDINRAADMAKQGVDYVAFGAMYSSQTKPQATAAPLEVLSQARQTLAPDFPALGLVAIGGITLDNARHVLSAGADSLAVLGGLFMNPDITGTARAFTELFNSTTAPMAPRPAV